LGEGVGADPCGLEVQPRAMGKEVPARIGKMKGSRA
jgi:hypothetical protein